MSSQSDQSEEERKLASHVRDKVEECRSQANRIAHEGIWMTNIAYVLGYDGMIFNTTTRQYQPINRASSYLKRNRIHVNKILPTLQNRLARLAKNPPKYDVKPESNDTDDKEAARLGLQILTTKWDDLELNQKRIALYMWLQECGHAYIKISWDPALGKQLIDPADPKAKYEGDVRADIVSPFEIFPDPMAKRFEDLQWVIQAKVQKLDYFKTRYPERGHLVKEETAWLQSAQYEQRIQSINTRGPLQGAYTSELKGSAIELIKYEIRSEKYPQGRMIVCANGILLEDKPLPCGEIPFAKFDDIVVAGKYYSEAIVTHMRPVQDYFNEVLRRRSEWTKKMLAGKLIAARGSGLSQEALNDESGEVAYYDPVPSAPNGGMPMPMQIPNIPQYAYSEEDKANGHMNEISGISEVSRGQLPSASIPAVGMQLLVEQDETRIGIMTEQHEHAWARIGRLILKYVEEYYVTPRKLKIAGKNLEYTVKEVTGHQLNGNTDVTVIRGSTLPGSKALRRQEVLNAYQQGLLGDPQDPKVREKVLGMLEFGEVSEIWLDYGLDMAQIKRGIEKLKLGEPVPVEELDNHSMWVQELNRFRKSDNFEKLPLDIQLLIKETIEAHIQAIMAQNNMLPEQPPTPEDMAAEMGQPAGGGSAGDVPQGEITNV